MQVEATLPARRKVTPFMRTVIYSNLVRIRHELADSEGVYHKHHRAISQMEQSATYLVIALARGSL